MSIRKTTIIIMAVVTVGLILWDVYAYLFGSGVATISVVITDSAYYSPWIPLVAGGLMGHWFFPAKGSKD